MSIGHHAILARWVGLKAELFSLFLTFIGRESKRQPPKKAQNLALKGVRKEVSHYTMYTIKSARPRQEEVEVL